MYRFGGVWPRLAGGKIYDAIATQIEAMVKYDSVRPPGQAGRGTCLQLFRP